MVNWSPYAQRIINYAEGKKYEQVLAEIPQEYKRFKCHTCHGIVDSNPCPKCGETHLVEMCPIDHCHCSHEIINGIEYCPVCGQAVCPECGSHDVVQVSRVTGYLQDVSGWNSGKQQELKDRMRYDAQTGSQISPQSAAVKSQQVQPPMVPTQQIPTHSETTVSLPASS